MGLAAKKLDMYQEGMSKREFEKAWMEMMDRMHVIDEKVSKKADEVVLTMVLSHRQEIEHLQSECIRLNQELKELQKRHKHQLEQSNVKPSAKRNLWERLFRR